MKRNICTWCALLLVAFVFMAVSESCNKPAAVETSAEHTTIDTSGVVKPISGTWINLVYQDVRNKYTNPQQFDNTDPRMWEHKIQELSDMGVKYLVFMAVANEGKSYYPSQIMPWAYSKDKKSPVDAIMDKAGELGMKVFMSIGWAKDQDDNLRIPEIKNRQLEIMNELATIYGKHKALYGWYLPVEDCLCPIFADHAVVSVNDLSDKARSLTPGKKILISPYGISQSDYDNPAYAQQLAKLKVDIIAYQDEVGCVREQFPMPNLKKNWKKLRAIHDKLKIEMWANCETFTWENATNDRTSALIPAAYSRILSQQVAASTAPVDEIISFMICGIIENPESEYQLGQPVWSHQVYKDYMDWKNGSEYWKLFESSLLGTLSHDATKATIKGNPDWQKLVDGRVGEESTQDGNWVKFEKGYNELIIDLKNNIHVEKVMLRLLNYKPEQVVMPEKVYLSTSADGTAYKLLSVKDAPSFPNNNHDAWINTILFDKLDGDARYVKIEFDTSSYVYMDEVYVNPSMGK